MHPRRIGEMLIGGICARADHRSGMIDLAARTPPAASASHARIAWRDVWALLCIAAIGVELAVLVAWAPDTLRYFRAGPIGDFRNFYEPARDLRLVGLYNPVLAPALYPLHWLGALNAYRALFVANWIAVLWIAWTAQRGASTPESRVAVALAVISLPQMHWAIRLGHFTPLLAAAALGGLLLACRRPRAGAIVLSLLSLKPQYAAAPFLHLARRRRSDAALMLGAAAAMAFVGFAAIGFASVRTYLSLMFDWGPQSADNLLPVQQSWLYSWPGVQISLGMEPLPPITFALIAMSFAFVILAWLRTDAIGGACVTAFAMLLLTPYSQFYDFALVVVGLALLLRCGIAPAAKAAMFAGLYGAALYTQSVTIFPAGDAFGAGGTDGPYIITPAVLGAVAALAVFGRPGEGAR